jgi:hypothetical protein
MRIARALACPALLAAASATLFAAAPARAQDAFEIQVYDAEINAPGQASLQVHLNATPSGRRDARYSGELAPRGSYHVTLEPALGVADWFEAGGYLQLLGGPGAPLRYGGAKLRAKVATPERLGWPVRLALNFEVSAIPRIAEPSTWGSELRPIVSWEGDCLSLSFNPILGMPLSGEGSGRVDFAPAAKVAVNTQAGFGLGLEYYTGLGELAQGLLPLSEQFHLLVFAFDLLEPAHGDKKAESPWQLNAGVGFGLTSGTDPSVVIKAIVGRYF